MPRSSSQHGLLPVVGARVTHTTDKRVGIVTKVDRLVGKLVVRWSDQPGKQMVVDLSKLSTGLRPGMSVEEVPTSATRASLGEGEVIATRNLGHHQQILVYFPDSGYKGWLPWQRLRHHRPVYVRLARPRPTDAAQAERFRLRCLAYALQFWNENTGALSRLDIDPLPHQVHVVHRILSSGNLNWMLADDVGLGKTIEVGMLLAALERRGTHRRILIVSPSGLCKQWQDELREKFGMDDFLVHGTDFVVNEPIQWKLYDHVIGSVDRLKTDDHLPGLLAAGDWDLVVFDEAHRLSRRQWGQKIDASDRFRLAAALRTKTPSMLLLTATPHQGLHDKFQALLELIRPELRHEIRTLNLNPDILRDIVIRNQKASVTDDKGILIFKGKTTHAIEILSDEKTQAFDRDLQKYLKRGYAAGRQRGRQGLAIGFVMTVYRKLAASCAAAIHTALTRRHDRLRGELKKMDEEVAPDERFHGEWEERQAGEGREFFVGEIQALEKLIKEARLLVEHDTKIATFIDGLVERVLKTNPNEKVLIFTEYRVTQTYLAEQLEERFGGGKVVLIHGGQTSEERRGVIAEFETSRQFLVSTEAGGEGINLQRYCHIMVNFDLPWNPMRLVQRIGRLYRYGQKNTVVVFNVHAPQTLDAQVMNLMYQRIDAIVRDMATLGGEFNAGMAEDILGQVANVIDVDEILNNALDAGFEQTSEDIAEALRLARKAVELQDSLFDHVDSYDPRLRTGELNITPAHLRAFAEGMFRYLGIEILQSTHANELQYVLLPEKVAKEIGRRGTRLWVTSSRDLAVARRDAHLLDLDSPLLQLMFHTARGHRFGGLACNVANLPTRACIACVLRWQDSQGRRMRQELCLVDISDDEQPQVNSLATAEWLKGLATGGESVPVTESASAWLDVVAQVTSARLDQVSTSDLHPEHRQWAAGAWQES